MPFPQVLIMFIPVVVNVLSGLMDSKQHFGQKLLLLVINNGLKIQWILCDQLNNTLKIYNLPTSFISCIYCVNATRYWYMPTQATTLAINVGYISSTQVGLYVDTTGSHAGFIQIIGY